MSIRAETFVDACRSRGYDFFAGVPCSFIKPLINRVIGSEGLRYVGAASEGEVLGITSGAWLAGRGTVAMCQNSGFGNMVNPLTSLNRPFGIPTLLVTTWRGQPGLKDEPQHEQMGRILRNLIECLEIEWHPFPEEPADVSPAINRAIDAAENTRRPVVLIMKHGTVEAGAEIPDAVAVPPAGRYEDRRAGGLRPTRRQAIEAILAEWPAADPIVATTGMTGRELFTVCDRPNHLYTVGSMGCASAIGLGFSLARPGRHTLVLDGDGAALMKLGNFSTIGREKPESLIHVVLNNGTHDSTGGQHTAGLNVDFAGVAIACGYATGTSVVDGPALAAAVARARTAPGPHLIEAAILPGTPPGVGRPTITPREVVDRFRSAMAAAA